MFSGTPWTTSAGWRRSSRCSIGSCVEVLVTQDRVVVRDSKQNDRVGDQPLIDVDPAVWRTFLNELLGSAASGSNGVLQTESLPGGWIALVDTSTGLSLHYDDQEWTAFVEGVALGELVSPV